MKRRRGLWWALGAVAAVALALGMAGCANVGYYWQSASGHLGIMAAARPVPEWLADPKTPEALRQRLTLAQRIRTFASAELDLPDNASYTAYADLHRRAALWNVVAAPKYGLALHTWCFPVAGCVGYRGYYSAQDAQAEAASLRAQGLEAVVYPVPAYSTLGWMNWAGGDPLLSTFIGYPEGELARIIFHELAHQVVYVAGDTMFNESYATAVERLGGARWLAKEADPAARQDYARFDLQRQQFRALALDTRLRLERVYASPEASAGDWAAVERMKQAAMADFRTRYAALREHWSGPRQHVYDPWVAQANNAAFGAQAAYDQMVPAFEALFAQAGRESGQGGDPWPRFFAAVKAMAKEPKAQRDDALQALARQAAPGDAARTAVSQGPGQDRLQGRTDE